MYSNGIKSRARDLRKDGLSILAIAKQLDLSKSTVSLWVSDVPLPKVIRKKLVDNATVGLKKALQILKAKRELQRIDDYDEAMGIIDLLVKPQGSNFWKFCAAMFFWCEGGKRSLSCIKFANSDPYLIRAFIKSLDLGFGIDRARLKALVHLHDYHSEKKELSFWSRVTCIPIGNFYKSYRKQNGGQRERKEYHGCICINYMDAALAKKLSALYHAFAEKFIGL